MALRTMLYGSMSRSTPVCVSSSMDGIPDYLDYDDQINPRGHLGKTTAHPGQLCPGRPWLTVWVALVRGVLPIITKRVSIDPIVSTCRISPAVARRQDRRERRGIGSNHQDAPGPAHENVLAQSSPVTSSMLASLAWASMSARLFAELATVREYCSNLPGTSLADMLMRWSALLPARQHRL